MIIDGQHNSAKVFTDNIDQETIGQVIELCNQEWIKDSKIRIMSDCHKGAGCVIGTTMTIKDKICPNLVGVDINCGIYAVKLEKKTNIDYNILDKVIRKYIPYGQHIREIKHKFVTKGVENMIKELKCFDHINFDYSLHSIGTLGGGNHYIEIDKSEDGHFYIVVHSGSRHLGKQVAEYYQNLAIKKLTDTKEIKQKIIEQCKLEQREKDIQAELKKVKPHKIIKHLAYVEGQDLRDYLYDINILKYYANLNRIAIIGTIVLEMGWQEIDAILTTHNYIDTENMILRKGAVSSQKGEELIIPMNMRDGALLCVGKGNEDWNYSAPHGAGRIMSRSQAKQNINLNQFQDTMKNVWSTSVTQDTVDESPMVYKPMEEIISNIQDTVKIKEILKPVYNFKASE
jgi:RNA-splicing ligase RtcB